MNTNRNSMASQNSCTPVKIYSCEINGIILITLSMHLNCTGDTVITYIPFIDTRSFTFFKFQPEMGTSGVKIGYLEFVDFDS